MKVPNNTRASWGIMATIAELTGLSYEVVESVFKAQELLIYDKCMREYQEDPDVNCIDFELPLLGCLKIYPLKYYNRRDVRHNAANRPKFYSTRSFRERLRKSMYDGEDLILNHCFDKFKNNFIEKFRSLI